MTTDAFARFPMPSPCVYRGLVSVRPSCSPSRVDGWVGCVTLTRCGKPLKELGLVAESDAILRRQGNYFQIFLQLFLKIRILT